MSCKGAMFSWGYSLIKSIVADCTIKNLVFNSSLLNNQEDFYDNI